MKSILVFSNGEKIGDGIIKLPLLNEFKRRLPNYKLYWMTDQGSTVYASTLKNIASSYIYTFFENNNTDISKIWFRNSLPGLRSDHRNNYNWNVPDSIDIFADCVHSMYIQNSWDISSWLDNPESSLCI